MLSDTKNLLYYFRRSPDGRMVFGGRAAFTPTPVARSAEILQRGMVEVFPELAGTPIDYAWGGQVAFTLDQMPHAGRLDDVYYALGYGGPRRGDGHLARRAHGRRLAGSGPDAAAHGPFPPDPVLQRHPVVPPVRGRLL